MAFPPLAYLIDIDWLKEAYRRPRKEGAVGVDGVTAEEFEQACVGGSGGKSRRNQSDLIHYFNGNISSN